MGVACGKIGEVYSLKMPGGPQNQGIKELRKKTQNGLKGQAADWRRNEEIKPALIKVKVFKIVRGIQQTVN